MDKGLTKRIIALLLAFIMAFVMLPVTSAAALGGDVAESPEGLTATSASSGSVKLVWAEVDGATGYIVSRATEVDGTYSAITMVSETEYVDNSAKHGQMYYYKVQSLNKYFVLSKTEVLVDIQSGDTTSIVAAHIGIAPALLPPPTGAINARSVSYDQINLTFERVSGALGYSIKRALSPAGEYVEVGTIADPGGSGQVVYEDMGLLPETTYFYKIATIDSEGVGAYITGYVDATTWKNPSDLAAPVLSISRDASDPGTFILTWPDVSGATSYRIYRAKNSNDPTAFNQLESFHMGSPYVDDSTKEADATYYYYVVAENATNQSENSNIVNMKAPNPGLEPPFISVNLKSGEETTAVVTWDAVDGANSYEVYRKETETGSFVSLGIVNVPRYEDPGRTPSSTYWYKVVAIGDIGRSPDSNIEFITIPDNLPGTIITNGYYLPGTNNIEIVWDHIAKADRYEIQMKTPGSGFTTMTTVNSPATTQVFNNLPKGITYTFRIYTKQGTLTGPVSNEYTVKEKLPGALNLTAEGTSISTIDVNWQQVSGNNGYKLYRSTTENGTYSPIADLGKDVTYYQDTGLPSNTTYWYKVFAIDSEGDLGLESNKDDGTTLKSLLPGALNLVAEGTSTSTIDVDWQQVSGNNGYKLYRSTTENGTYSPIADLGKDINHYQDTGLPQNTTYWYKVYAVDTDGNLGLESNKDDGTTLKSKLPCPLNLVAEGTSTSTIYVSWQQVSGNNGYRLYRSNTENGTYLPIADLARNVPYYQDTGLPANTTYWYKVYAIDSAGDLGLESNKDDGTTWPEKCPITVTVCPFSYGCNAYVGNQVSWTPVKGATSYYVFRSIGNENNYQILCTTRYTNYTDSNLTANTTYYYRILANTGEVGVGCGTTPGKALCFKACNGITYLRDLGVNLSWQQQNGISYYTIYRSTNQKDWELLTQVSGTSFGYVDRPVSPKTTYYYKLVASTGQTEQAKVVTCTQLLSLCAANRSGYVQLSWLKISNAKSYTVYRSADGYNYQQIGSTDGNTTYFYDYEYKLYYRYYYYKVISDNDVGAGYYLYVR